MTGVILANLGSIIFASSDSSAVNIRSKFSGLMSSTLLITISLMYSGTSSLLCQRKMPEFGSRIASMYFFPADLSDAATCASSNHLCLFRPIMNSWPTAPVAPMTATLSIYRSGLVYWN
jgi:hypothetical protein